MTHSTTLPRITRRGFRNVSADLRQRANERVDEYVGNVLHGGQGARVWAELRPASDLGPGSAGDRGAYTLYISSNVGACDLRTLEA